MVFKSPFEDLRPPEEFKDSLSEFFWHQLDVHADKTLIVDFASGRQWTGAQIKKEATRIARYLIAEAGLKPRDSCVFFYPNSDHIHLVALGVLFAGGSVCAGAAADPEPEHRHMIESMRPAIVFAEAQLYRELADLRAADSSADSQFAICILNDQDEQYKHQLNGTTIGLHKHILAYQPADESAGSGRLPVAVEPGDAAYVLLTSGSTGRPKPVARTHRNSLYVCYSFQSVPELWHMDERSVLAGHLPLDHGTGTFSIKMTLTKGLKLIVMDGYQPETLVAAIERHQITDCILGSALLHNFISEPLEPLLAKHSVGSLRNLIAVGSPIPSHQAVLKFIDKYPEVSIRQAFGMTECGFVSVVPRAECRTESRGVGKLLPNITVKLLDRHTGTEVTQFEREGELYLAGPTVSPGYIGAQHAELSRAVFLADGFYRTNDISELLADGSLVIKGRYSEVLCLGDGWKVLPYEIETALLEHPAILEAAVVGIPHPELPTCHAPRAYVVLREAWRGKLQERDVCEFATKHLSEPKHLTGGVRLLEDHLPRISCGKLDKKALRKMDGY